MEKRRIIPEQSGKGFVELAETACRIAWAISPEFLPAVGLFIFKENCHYTLRQIKSLVR